MYGLVLEGGGAKGSYHVGAYKAILEEGLEIKGVTGTSIGSINGAMIVQGDFERCYDIWNNIEYSMIIEGNNDEVMRLFDEKMELSDLKVLLNSLRHVISKRGVDIRQFKRILDDLIDEEKLRRSFMDYGLVTINLTDLKAVEIFKEDIPQGELKNYILASSYLPIFKREKIGGKRYLDGAFYDNLPFKLLQSKGYQNFVLVRTLARGITRKVDMDNAIVVSPREDLGSIHQYDYDSTRKNIRLGYYDCLKAIRGLKGHNYYINPGDESYYFHQLTSLSEDKINQIGEYIKTPEVTSKRMLFEYLIPKLGILLGLGKDFTYEDLLIMLLEVKADSIGIDRFRIYDYEELKNLVVSSQINEHKSRSKSLKSIFNRDRTLQNIADVIFSKTI